MQPSIRVALSSILFAATVWNSAALVPSAEPAADPHPQRIVCLGDSITDGNTYPLLVQAALAAAGKPVPVMINAGIGGDTAEGMLARLERDVFARRPDVVLLSVGINDFGAGVPREDFLARVEKIIDQALERHVDVVLLTMTQVRDADSQRQLEERNAALRTLAANKKIRVADVAAAFAPAVAAGKNLWEADGCHLSFAGYRRMVRGVLDGLGYADVAVPEKLELQPLPGLLSPWRVRLAPDDKPLDAAAVAGIQPDASWTEYSLPEREPHESWFFDQERQRGFATRLKQRVGAGDRFQAIATLDAPAARRAYLRTGSDVRRVWLNGRLAQQVEHGSWHVRQETPIELNAGWNTLLIETGPMFFVSVVDQPE